MALENAASVADVMDMTDSNQGSSVASSHALVGTSTAAASGKPSIGDLLSSFEAPPRRLFHSVWSIDISFYYMRETHPINPPS